jgi:exodeoxyribonuclease V gamma subunit
MLKIYKSNTLYRLADILAGRLAADAPEDPFLKRCIVVPNRDTARWLKLCLAEKNGIVANIEFLLPSEWQFRQIRKLYKTLPSLLPSDPGPLTWAIFSLLLNDDKRKKFTRADHYIKNQPAEKKELAAMQLAEKIASVFDQYLVYRPELILKWQSGTAISDSDERWQAEMWNLLENERVLREKGTGFPNRAELQAEANEAIKKGDITAGDTIFYFNTGLIPKPVIRMADRFSAQTEVAIFQLSVTRNADGAGPEHNPLLEAFGDEAKGAGHLYDELNGTSVSEFRDIPRRETLLQRFQKSILENEPVGNWDPNNEGEFAIEIHSCHTPLREIEVLHQFLLRAFEADPGLHPDDILVMMPNPDAYKPLIHAVFGSKSNGLPEIPYHAGYDVSDSSGLVRLFLQLLDLADSRLEFSEVMDFFMEEPVREKFEVSESGAERIKRWMEENNVIWGLDRDHRIASNQPGDELNTWQTAMRRGWRGILLGAQENPFEENDLSYLQAKGGDREMEWSSFSAFLGQLRVLSSETESKKTVTDWCGKMENLLNSFFSKKALSDIESNAIIPALQKTRDFAVTSKFERKVPFSLIRRALRNLLSVNRASAAVFSRGVTFTSMVPVRSIPAKIIALIGLNESEFPRKENHIDFDLMAREPDITDRNRKNEDRNLFLESILAAGRFHYCSYIGRSRKDDEPIPPSPIVSEWLNQISGATGIKPDNLITQEPIHGFSAGNFREKRSFAKTEYSVAQLLESGSSDYAGFFMEGAIGEEDETVISLDNLLGYYKNPVAAFFKQTFQPEVNTPDELRNEFALSSLEKHILFEKIFGWKLEDVSDEEILNLLYSTGSVPAGWQGKALLCEMIKNAGTAIDFLHSQEMVPEVHPINIDIPLYSNGLKGSFTSFQRDGFLDITPSSYGGSKVVRSWICHLAASARASQTQSESYLLCNLKKGKPVFITFKPVQNARKILSELAGMYRSGIAGPLKVFPETTYEYMKCLKEGKGNEMAKAALTFEGSDFSSFSENRDFYVSLLMGSEPAFSPECINPGFQKILDKMFNCMEVNK